MSHAAPNPAATVVAAHNGHHHDPHLAHHFDTPEQQYQSGKLGMWVFLATEILMFGGLFCAYSVYRHNHPDVFAFAHKALDPVLGGINTVVLIASSLTMAWGVRAAQLNQKRTLVLCLILTILGGAGFMAIKSIEYKAKWEHHLFPGSTMNVYNKGFKGEERPPIDLAALNAEGHHGGHEASDTAANPDTQRHTGAEHAGAAAAHKTSPAGANSNAAARMAIVDPNAGTPDEAKIKPNFAGPVGLAPQADAAAHQHILYTDLDRIDRARVPTFFSVYFLMTGLHGFHVVVGMALMFWILLRSIAPGQRVLAWGLAVAGTGLFFVYLGLLLPSHVCLWAGVAVAVVGLLIAAAGMNRARHATGEGEFGPTYFAPVDFTGLYWHLVDLIWIFLFPLLYLIH
jgi:cytochrome c oxidase subunit 3